MILFIWEDFSYLVGKIQQLSSASHDELRNKMEVLKDGIKSHSKFKRTSKSTRWNLSTFDDDLP